MAPWTAFRAESGATLTCLLPLTQRPMRLGPLWKFLTVKTAAAALEYLLVKTRTDLGYI